MSTNAGGLRLMRYGSLRGNILGVEAVSVCGEGGGGGDILKCLVKCTMCDRYLLMAL